MYLPDMLGETAYTGATGVKREYSAKSALRRYLSALVASMGVSGEGKFRCTAAAAADGSASESDDAMPDTLTEGIG